MVKFLLVKMSQDKERGGRHTCRNIFGWSKRHPEESKIFGESRGRGSLPRTVGGRRAMVLVLALLMLPLRVARAGGARWWNARLREVREREREGERTERERDRAPRLERSAARAALSHSSVSVLTERRVRAVRFCSPRARTQTALVRRRENTLNSSALLSLYLRIATISCSSLLQYV